MQFTDAESAAFWLVYQDYATGQVALGDERTQLIKDYARSYETLDDANARDMVQRMINIEDKTLNLREDYWPKFMKALGAKRAAKFYQVDKEKCPAATPPLFVRDLRGFQRRPSRNLGSAACAPLQKGLFSDLPQRHRVMRLRPS